MQWLSGMTEEVRVQLVCLCRGQVTELGVFDARVLRCRVGVAAVTPLRTRAWPLGYVGGFSSYGGGLQHG